MALSQFFNNLWEKVRQAPTFVPTYIEFPGEKTDGTESLPEEFDDKKHYFMISVTEMFLSYQRLWHQNFSPMVFSVCNFKYDGKTIEIPYVIGPSHLKKFEQRLPKGMLFMNTPIVGIYPWRGGNVSLSLILCSVKEVNNIEKVLNIIEEVSNSLDFSAGIESYTKVGRVVLKGFDSLLGFEQTNPLLGLNNNFGQAAGNPFRPGYFALIRADGLDKNKFWVKNKQLCYGDSLATAQPYRDDDFILFNIGISESRKDLESLDFYNDYKRIYNYIKENEEISSSKLEKRMVQLAVTIQMSPDLTYTQANRIWNEKAEEINNFMEKLSKLDGASPATETLDPVDQIMEQAMKDLKF